MYSTIRSTLIMRLDSYLPSCYNSSYDGLPVLEDSRTIGLQLGFKEVMKKGEGLGRVIESPACG